MTDAGGPTMTRRGYLAANAMLAGLLTAIVLSAEVLVVALASGGITELAGAIPGAWSIGLAVGGGVGSLLSLLRPSASRVSAEVGRVSFAWEHGVWVLCAGCGAVAIVQINHHLLPDFFSLASLAVTSSLAGLTLALARGLGGRVKLRRRRAFPFRAVTAAVLGSFVLALGQWAAGRGLAERAPAPELWVPPSVTFSPGPEDDGADGRSKLLVIGIDGACWGHIDPLLESGRLPHLQELLERGRGGVLRCEEGCVSPIAWTTIFTGRPPADHGITEWDLSLSTNRRVKALWSILDDLGRTSYVSHVPSTYPAEKVRGGVVAGFPLPEGVVPQHEVWMNKTYSGWLVYQGGPPPAAGGPISVPFRASNDGPTTVSLALASVDPPLERTALFLASERFSRWSPRLGEPWRRWILETSRRAGLVPVTIVAELDLELRKDGNEGEWRVSGTGSSAEELFDLAPGEWGPWLAVGFEGGRFLLRPRLIEAGRDQMRLFMTPLLAERTPGGSMPAELASWFLRPGRPYFVVGAGLETYYEASVLEAFAEHHLQLETYRAEAALDLMEATEWDAFIHHFVVTDWFSHVFAQFEAPARFGAPNDYRYGAHEVDGEQLRAWAGYLGYAYEEVDRWLGEFLDRVDDSTTVLILSDHGSQAPASATGPPARGGHHQDGIYVIAGPTVSPATGESARKGPRLSQIDVLPLVLTHLGVPVARDMPGRIPSELWPRNPDGSLAEKLPPVVSYEDADSPSGGVETLDESTREMLRSLGYLE
jgi:hypothetical protein